MTDELEDHRIGKAGKPQRLLTIAMPVVDDHRGVSMTTVNLVNQLDKYKNLVDFLIVDNSPDTAHGSETRKLVKNLPNGKYIGLGGRRSNFLAKQACIDNAETEYVLVLDSHMLLQQQAICRLLNFCNYRVPTNDLFHGPMVNEQFEIIATHMNPMFGNNFGRWGQIRDAEKRTVDPSDYYEIPMHGMACFFCRRDAWVGFNPAMHHFGSEEGYVHEKYRLLGRKVWSMPFLKWWHNFSNARDLSFSICWEHKYRNACIAWTEIGQPLDILDEAYAKALTNEVRSAIRNQVASLQIRPIPHPVGYVPFMGYPVRVFQENRPDLEDYRSFENLIYRDSVATYDSPRSNLLSQV